LITLLISLKDRQKHISVFAWQTQPYKAVFFNFSMHFHVYADNGYVLAPAAVSKDRALPMIKY